MGEILFQRIVLWLSLTSIALYFLVFIPFIISKIALEFKKQGALKVEFAWHQADANLRKWIEQHPDMSPNDYQNGKNLVNIYITAYDAYLKKNSLTDVDNYKKWLANL